MMNKALQLFFKRVSDDFKIMTGDEFKTSVNSVNYIIFSNLLHVIEFMVLSMHQLNAEAIININKRLDEIERSIGHEG